MERYGRLNTLEVVVPKTQKDYERDQLAEDIKAYLNNGGTITKFNHGATALGDSINKVWEKTLRNDPSKKG
tara:strand:- start:2786 stop:2998 length:213 start_codon:yes stop_codon:yes gene_type:complete